MKEAIEKIGRLFGGEEGLPSWWLWAVALMTLLLGLVALAQQASSGSLHLGGGLVLRGSSALAAAWGIISGALALLAACLGRTLRPRPDSHYFRRIQRRLAARPWPEDPDSVSELLAELARTERRFRLIEDHVVIELGRTECILVKSRSGSFLPGVLDEPEAEEPAEYLFFSPSPLRAHAFPGLTEALLLKLWSPCGCLYEAQDLPSLWKGLSAKSKGPHPFVTP